MGLVTRQHKICNLKPDRHVNFLANFTDVLTLWPMLSFSFNLFICPSSVTNVELRMLKVRKASKEKWEKEGCASFLGFHQSGESSEAWSSPSGILEYRGYGPRRQLSQVNKPKAAEKMSQGWGGGWKRERKEWKVKGWNWSNGIEGRRDSIAGSAPRDWSVPGLATATAPPSGCPTSSVIPLLGDDVPPAAPSRPAFLWAAS